MGETYSTIDKKHKFKECYIVEENDSVIIANCSYYKKEFDEINSKYNTTSKKITVKIKPTF